MTSSPASTTKRIRGEPVPPLVPTHGRVHVLLVGEAPGPRGADKSGVPFFGDAAGKHLYRALMQLGALSLPFDIESVKWDGALFASSNWTPTALGIALGNAFDRCPTDDGASFRAPTRKELEGDANVARIAGEIDRFAERGLRGVVTLGRVATRTIDVVLERATHLTLERRAVPHPSAQGLLSMVPNRGRGARMHDLQSAWIERCMQAVRDAGYSREDALSGTKA